jgi:DNA-binding winged helix-turn-helix (wHTH) protein
MPRESSYKFGKFFLDPSSRELLCGKHKIQLRAKPFELLLVLVENQGNTISKSELMSRVWPGTIVSDVNFHVTLNMIRKALGESARKPVHILRTANGYCLLEKGRSGEDLSDTLDPNK